MVESWNIGMREHDSYAKRVEGLREYKETLKLTPSETGVIAHHTTILKLKPEVPQLVLLMHLNRRKTWAHFTVPEEYFQWRRRRSYFLDPNEKVEADREKVASYIEQHRGYDQTEGEQEGQTLIHFLSEVTQYNEWVDEVQARMRQFLQG